MWGSVYIQHHDILLFFNKGFLIGGNDWIFTFICYYWLNLVVRKSYICNNGSKFV